VKALQAVGADVREGQVFYMGSSEGVYQVIETLKPLPLVQVKKDSADLTEIFLKLVGERSDA
jgi:ABC-2 type transport system ATP-binding protein